jgi:nitric oxide reductase NorQ protein
VFSKGIEIQEHILEEHGEHPFHYCNNNGVELDSLGIYESWNPKASFVDVGGWLIPKIDQNKLDPIDKTQLTKWGKTPYVFQNDTASIVGYHTISGNKSPLLIGETGTGKTSMVKYIAAMRGQPYCRIQLDGGTTADQLLGKLILVDGTTVWRDGILTIAARRGWMVTLDEITAARADVLFALYSLFDDDRQLILTDKADVDSNFEVVKPHPNFRAFATTNPRYGAVVYTGVKTLNPALKDRFEPISIQYMPPDEEINYVIAETGAKPEVVGQLVDIASQVRKDSDRLAATFSTRLLIDYARYSLYMSVYDAMKVTLPAKMSENASSAILKMVGSMAQLSEFNRP